MADDKDQGIEQNQETITPAGVTGSELSQEELSDVSGGSAVKTISWSPGDDESPKETVTFEYGNP